MIFWSIRSPYGKKQMLQLRWLIAILFGAFSLLSLIWGDFSKAAWMGILPYVVLLILFELLLNRFFAFLLKRNINALKKKGKMGYSPVAEMEFHEESFSETTPDNKSEQKYSAIERVSVIRDTVIYLHVNSVMSYILPFSCFASTEQRDQFLAFLKTKCASIDIY